MTRQGFGPAQMKRPGDLPGPYRAPALVSRASAHVAGITAHDAAQPLRPRIERVALLIAVGVLVIDLVWLWLGVADDKLADQIGNVRDRRQPGAHGAADIVNHEGIELATKLFDHGLVELFLLGRKPCYRSNTIAL